MAAYYALWTTNFVPVEARRNQMSIKQRDTLIMGALEEAGKPRPQPGIGLRLFGPMTPAQHARLSSLMGVVDDDDPNVT